MYSTVLIHSAKVVDVAEYYIKMDEFVESKEFKDAKKELKENDEDKDKTIGDIFKIDDDTPYYDSIAFIMNYIDAKTIEVYLIRLMIFATVSVILIVLSLYLILNNKKCKLLFIIELIGILVIEYVSKSTLFTASFVYLPVLGSAYYIYKTKINTSN
jgi:hypothetical protein